MMGRGATVDWIIDPNARSGIAVWMIVNLSAEAFA
jgi:hypothetical protein